MNSVISLNHISKKYGDYEALSDIEFSVSQGEIFGLLGPSGAGKTTIIKIITGQLKCTNGEAFIWGKNCQNLTEDIYAQIGMVLDSSGIYTRLSCYDNLKLFTGIYGISKERIIEVMDAVKLSDVLKRPAGKLSKGMMQRLVFARAILHRPKLLFLDEPTSGLDPATTLEIHKYILELKNQGTTILITTHNMEEATKLCDYIALLNDGKIIEYGEPKAICRKYDQRQIISVLQESGEMIEVPLDKNLGNRITTIMKEGKIVSIHSSEPDLETVFINLTGRKLV